MVQQPQQTDALTDKLDGNTSRSMKRKRATTSQRHHRAPSSTPDDNEMFQKKQQDYYNRLMYQCRKDLNKHIKITKKFEIQKQIRKVKDTTSQEHKNQNVVKQEQKLQLLKDYSTEPVIHECFRRLGILQLDPKWHPGHAVTMHEPDPASVDVNNVGNFDHSDVGNCNEKVDSTWILDRIMKHKTIINALEHWNEEVTEYRRWCLRQQERNDRDSDIYENSSKKGEKTPKNTTSKVNKSMPTFGNGSSLFVTLGNSSSPRTAGNSFGVDPSYSYYGPAGDDTTAKKNRPGQRARRAKVAAIEAKQQGRILRPEESLNWRRSATKQPSTEPTDLPPMRRRSAQAQKSDAMIPVEELHPSWQARKGKKEGIVAFQGKKITFEDEQEFL